MKKCVMGTYWNHLTVLPTAYGEIRKKSAFFGWNRHLTLSYHYAKKAAFAHMQKLKVQVSLFSVWPRPFLFIWRWSDLGIVESVVVTQKPIDITWIQHIYYPKYWETNSLPYLSLTLVLLIPDISCLYKQCRSRSVGFWRSQLIWICTVCH